MSNRALRKLKIISMITILAVALTIIPQPAWGLDLGVLKNYALSVTRKQAETAFKYANHIKNLSVLNIFKDNPENRLKYQNKEQAVKDKVELNTLKINQKYDSLITKRIDSMITPATNRKWKFIAGAAEGVPKGILDLALCGYNFVERTTTSNLFYTSMNTYYKVKDNQEAYKETCSFVVKHPVLTGAAVTGALLNGGKDYAVSLYHDPRAAGNLVGAFVGLGGTAGAVKKGLPAATNAFKGIATLRIPTVGATPVAVGATPKIVTSKSFYEIPSLSLSSLGKLNKNKATSAAGAASDSRIAKSLLNDNQEFKVWIKHDTYNQVRNLLGKKGVEKFINAAQKGLVGAQGENGIKLISGNGMKEGGKFFKYELKVLGKDMSHYRILGNFNKETKMVIFDKLINK